MQVSISARPDAAPARTRLDAVLGGIPARIVACSGGIDSLVLSVLAHRGAPTSTVIAHTVTPAVPGDGTARVVEYAAREGWDLRIVRSDEFGDEEYLANPVDRCYHCKRNLYDAVGELVADALPDAVVLSGANLDDLGEYRPGLAAASERSVRHPFVEAEVTKSEIRAIARQLDLGDADLPASPCLASRLYTGTRVTPARLRAIEAGEALVRERTGISVVRCRVSEDSVLVEVGESDRDVVTDSVLAGVSAVMSAVEPSIARIRLDDRAYAPGRAFVGASDSPQT